MTKEDKEFLKQNFTYIEQAGTKEYILGVPMAIAQEYFNIANRNNIKTGSLNCHKCVYNACKALYNLYMSEMKKETTNINNNQDSSIISNVTETTTKKTKTKKNGRNTSSNN